MANATSVNRVCFLLSLSSSSSSSQLTGSPVRSKGVSGQRSRTPVGGPSSGQPPQQQQPTITVKGVEQKLVQIVLDEIVEGGARVNWTDIVGQEVSSLVNME